MPEYRRRYVEGGTYFFTVNLADRGSDLLVREIAPLRSAFRYARRRYPFQIDAIIVLPDHLHCIWTLPEGHADYRTRWRLIKTEFTRSLSNAGQGRRPGERSVWQRRFWEHVVRDADELIAYTDYIHWNPVKHGHVEDLDDWPYSSWHRYKRDSGLEHDPKRWAQMQFGERP